MLPAVFSAPALMVNLYLADPAQFRRDGPAWAAVLVVAALLAMGLIAVTGRGPTTVGRLARRTPVLLAVTTLAALVPVVLDLRRHDPPDLHHQSIAPLLTSSAALWAMLLLWWIGDGGSSRVEPVEPVTVEQVRQVTTAARKTLRRVRAENDRIESLLRDLEAKLAHARLEMGFHGLCELHWESRGCADRAHQHYRSADGVLNWMSRTQSGVPVALRRKLVPVRGGRPDRLAYASATTTLTATQNTLKAEVRRGRAMLDAFNQRTGTLKHRIRDECGPRGKRWFDDLQERIAARS